MNKSLSIITCITLLVCNLLSAQEIIEDKNETDVMDYDGIGNYGRIPNKDS